MSPIKGEPAPLIAPLDTPFTEKAPFAEPVLADETPTTPVVVDPEAERAAFAALLTLLKATDDGDADTVITVLSAEQFAEDTFTPAPEEKPQ
jgi:hypothetical protein